MAWKLVAALLLAAMPLAAQTLPDSSDAEWVESERLESLAETGDAEELADMLGDLRAHPLDLNAAAASELAQIPGITPLLAHRIVAYRDSAGVFNSLPEMQRVPGITAEVYAAVRPYLRLGAVLPVRAQRASRFPRMPRRQAWREVNGQLIQRYARRLETARGYSENRYAGTPDRLYTRLRLSAARRVSLNLTLDKDPGEAFTWNPGTGTLGYDFVSAYVAAQDLGRFKQAVIGDFTASFGQGLVLWRSAALGKSREATRGLNRAGSGIRPYGSIDENRFFRGLATTVLLTPELAVTAFYSRRTLDATILDPDTGGVASFGTTGLHRLETEIARKDALGETTGGSALEYVSRRFRVGAAFVDTGFDQFITRRGAPDARFAFEGQRARAGSVFGHFFAGDAVFFGEAARAGEATALLGGVEYAVERVGEITLLGRLFPRDFVSLHGYAFGERMGATQNERGFYLGLRLRPRQTWIVQAYFDQYTFPWLRFNVPRPTSGYDALFSVIHTPRPWLRQDVILRSETREEAATTLTPSGQLFATVAPQTRQSARWQGSYVFSRRLTLRTRLEASRFKKAEARAAHGFLLFQDVRLHPTSTLTLDLRYALYQTDGYDARLYAYEYDVRYGFSIPALYGRGVRQYAVLRWTPATPITLEARYAVTRREDVTSLGSGLDATPGNRASEIKAQLIWKW